MNYRIRNLLIILITLTIVVGGIVMFFMNREAPPIKIVTEPETEKVMEQSTPQVREQVQENFVRQVEGLSRDEVNDHAAILSTARFFVERYGSYSSGSSWQNLKDLKSIVTPQMNQEFEELIEISEGKMNNQYFSLTTKVLNMNVESQSTDQAVVIADTQKRDVRGSEQEIYYKEVKVELVRSNNSWLVSEVSESKKRR